MNTEPYQVIDSSALAVMQRGEIDVQISTAKRYPRDLAVFNKKAMDMVTSSESIAEQCFYSFPRDNKNITGPSVRLAEICAQAFGNLRVGTRFISEDQKHVTAQSVCHDLENNVAISVEVKRRITNRSGNRYGDDMIAVTANAAAGIAFRNALFKVVPESLWKPLFDAARRKAIGDASTLVGRRTIMIDHYKKMGVFEDRLLPAIKRKNIDDIDLKDLEKLRGMATAIKDGDISIDEAFPLPKPENGGKKNPKTLDDVLPDVKPPPPPNETTTQGPPPKTEQPESEPVIGDGDTYKTINKFFMGLHQADKDSLKNKYGFKLITDVKKFTHRDANDLLQEILDMKNQTKKGGNK